MAIPFLTNTSFSAAITVATTGTFGGNVTLSGQAAPQLFLDSNTAGTPNYTLIANASSEFIIGRAGVSNDFILNSGNATFAGNVSVNNKIELYSDGTLNWGAAHDSGRLTFDTGIAVVAGLSGKSLVLRSNGSGSSNTALTLDTSQNATFAGDVSLITGKQLIFDGGTDATYISEDIADRLRFFVGGAEFMRFTENTTDDINFYHNATFAGKITVNGNGIDIDNDDDVRLRFDNAGAFKAGLQVATTAGDMIAESAVNDFAIRAQGNMLFASGGNTERLKLDTSGNATFAGNVTIGDNSASEIFLAFNSSATDFALGANGSNFMIGTSSDLDNNNLITLSGSNGNFGIGTTSPAQRLDVAGNVVIPYGNAYFMDTVGAAASNFTKTINNFETVVGTSRGSAGFGVFGNSDIRLGFGTAYTAAQTKLTLKTTGVVQFNAYDSTNLTGTPTYVLGTDASGNVVKVLGGDIPGGGGTVTGTGTTSRLTKFTDGANGVIGDSILAVTADSLDFTNADFAQIKFKESGAIMIDSDNNQSSRNFQIKDGSGSSLLTVLDTGNVGIGTTSPTAKLHITKDNTTGNALLITNSGSSRSLEINHNADGAGVSDEVVRIMNNSTRLFTIESNGNVGIGTTSPSTKLFVDNGESTFNRGNTSGTIATFRGLNSAQAVIGTATSYFTSNVGIGVTNPTLGKLQVASVIHVNRGGTNGLLANPYFESILQSGLNLTNLSSVQLGNSFGSDNGTYIRFQVNSTAAASTPLNILTLKGTGGVTLGTYTGTAQTGTPTFLLGTDASGNIVKTNTVPGSGAGPYLPLSAGGSFPLTGALNINLGSTNVATIKLRRNTTGDNQIVGDIEFDTTAAQGGDDRIALIRATTSGGDGTGRGGAMLLYTRQSGSANFNTTTYDKFGNWFFPSNVTTGGQITVPSGYSVNIGTSRIHSTSTSYLLGGNVGIGTTNPGAKLQVGSRGTAGALTPPVTDGILFDFHNDGNPYTRHAAIISQAGDASESVLDFWTKVASGTSAKKMTIRGNGNVGIGTTNPAQDFVVADATNGNGIELVPGTSATIQTFNRGSASYNNLNIDTNEARIRSFDHTTIKTGSGLTERMRITSGGNVGIGTTNPIELLHVAGAVAGNVMSLINNTSNSTSAYTILGFKNDFFNSSRLFLNSTNNSQYAGVSSLNLAQLQNNPLGFVTNNVLRMIVTGPGNVGIGTTSPGEKLEVTGGKVKINKQDEALIINAVSNNGSYILLTNSSTPYAYIGAANQIITAGAATQLGLRSQSDMLFSTGGLTERMRISSAGDVGIGTNSPGAKLEVAGGNGTVGGTGLVYFNNSDDAESLVINNAGTSSQNDRGVFDARIGGSSVFRINNSGRVGIGTTSPSFKLEVDTNGVHDGIKIRGANAPGLTLQDDSSSSTSSILIQSTASAQGNLRISADENNAATGATIEFKVSGSDKMRILANGNVGIGTTNPAEKLEVLGNIRANVSNTGGFMLTGASASGLVRNNASGVALRTNTTDRLIINNNGNLQLATYGAGTLVSDASGNITVSSGGGAGGPFLPLAGGTMNSDATINMNSGQLTSVDFVDFGIGQLNGESSSNLILKSLGDITYNVDSNNNGNSSHIFQESGSELMRIRYDGNVGIGTTSPVAKLHIEGSGGNGGILFNNASSQEHRIYSTSNTQFNLIGSSAPIWIFGQSDGSNNLSGTAALDLRKTLATFGGNINVNGQILTPGGSDLALNPNTGLVSIGGVLRATGTGTSYFTGNLGIGTTSPSAKLHTVLESTTTNTVLEVARFERQTTGTAAAGIGSAISFAAEFQPGSSAVSGQIASLWENVSTAAAAMTFSTWKSGIGLSEAMRINNDGSLKLNSYTLTQQTAASVYLLGVDSSGKVVQSTNIPAGTGGNAGPYLPLAAGSGSPLTGDLYYNGEIRSTTPAGKLILTNNSTTTELHAAGTGGIAFKDNANNTKAVINSSGNVGIGTTGPQAKLEIAGFPTAQGLRLNYGNSSGTIEAINFQANGGANGVIGMQMVSSNVGDLWLGGSGGRTLTLYRDGNVGIGTASPSTQLEIFNNNDETCKLRLGTSSTDEGTVGHEIQFQAEAGSAGVQGRIKTILTEDDNLDIQIINDTGTTPTATFFANKTVGIGRDNNAYQLGIKSTSNGSIFADGRIITATNLTGSTGNILGALKVGGSTAANSNTKLDVDGRVLIKDGTGIGDLYLGNYATANHFRFHTNNANTFFDMNCGDIYWRQGSSTRYRFFPSTANMTINGTLTQNSDARVKENVIEIGDCINKVKAMRGVYYNRTDFNTEVTKVGVIAQEVEAVLPELILENKDDGLKSVAYSELTAVLINAIKEQQEIIEDLKTRVQQLEN